MNEKNRFENETFFQIETLRDGSTEFDAEAECTCTVIEQPSCCSNSNDGNS